jgi:electron transport complex protein RnfA
MDYAIFVFILMNAVIVNNYVLQQFLGVCPFLGVSKVIKDAAGMGIAVTVVMVLATAVTWPIEVFILEANGLSYLRIVVFVLVIASLVQVTEITLNRYVPFLYKTLGVFLPLMATNCAILGLTIINITKEYTYVQSLVNAVGSGLGFLLAMVLFAGIRVHTENAKPVASFKGLPLTLISAAMLSMSFLGFGGVAENLFR